MSSFGWLAASQPAVLFSHTNSAPATGHQLASSIFLSQQISTSHQPLASRTRPIIWNGGSTMQCMIQMFCYFCIKSVLFSFKIGACDWQLSLQAMEKMVESLLVGFLILICMMLPVS